MYTAGAHPITVQQTTCLYQLAAIVGGHFNAWFDTIVRPTARVHDDGQVLDTSCYRSRQLKIMIAGKTGRDRYTLHNE